MNRNRRLRPANPSAPHRSFTGTERFTLILLFAVLVPLVGSVGSEGFLAFQADPGQASEPVAPASEPTAEGGASDTEAAMKGNTDPVVVSGKIDGEIGTVTSAYIKRLIGEVERREADALFLELNTFGGRVDAAVAVRDALVDLDVATLIFINKRAISAGALISLACDKIAMAPGGTIGAATPILSGPGAEVPQAVGEKYLFYFREEMRSTAETTGRDPDIAEAMVDKDKVVEGVSEEGKLLTLTTKRALELEFADFEAKDGAEALKAFGFPVPPQEVIPSWSESLVGFLTSSAIASLLFMAMMVLAYMEYQTPGFGFFGGGAIACFLVLYFSHYLVNLAGWEEMIFFVIGLTLLLLEAFVIPGFGLAGIAGFLCLLGSGVMLFLAGDWSELQLDNPFTLDAVQRVLLSTVLAFGVLVLMMRFPAPGRHRAGRALNSGQSPGGRDGGGTSRDGQRAGRRSGRPGGVGRHAAAAGR